MLGSSFQEGSDAASTDMLELQMTDAEPFVVQAALRWVYTDRVDADMPAEQLLQVCYIVLCCAVPCYALLCPFPVLQCHTACMEPASCSTEMTLGLLASQVRA